MVGLGYATVATGLALAIGPGPSKMLAWIEPFNHWQSNNVKCESFEVSVGLLHSVDFNGLAWTSYARSFTFTMTLRCSLGLAIASLPV